MDEYSSVTAPELTEGVSEREDTITSVDTAAEGPNELPQNFQNTEDEDYEELMRTDLEQLKREFPELERTESIAEIKNPLRYGALRDLGLSPTEAYLACRGKVSAADNRAHLHHSAPRSMAAPIGMSRTELEGARELFRDMSDAEIQSLYRRVTK